MFKEIRQFIYYIFFGIIKRYIQIAMLPDSSLNRTSFRSSFVDFVNRADTDLAAKKNQSKDHINLMSRYHDQSYINVKDFSKKKRKSQERIDKIIEQLDKVGLINPSSSLLLGWNFLVIGAILFNFYQIPIAIFLTEQVYKDQFQTTAGIIINSICITILLADLLLIRPNVAFYVSGRITKSHWQTLKNYLKLEFWFNLIGWIALFTYALADNHNFIYLKILFYCYILQLYRKDQEIVNKIQLLRLRFAFYKLFRLIFILLFIVLWLSCIYFAIDYSYFLAKNQYYPVNLWLTNSQCSQYQGGLVFISLPEMYNWYVWLNYAFYWTLQSISMVGYGDMTPRNPPQVAYCDVVVLLMTLMYAFFINSVWEIIAESVETSDQHQAKQKYLMKYEKNYGVKGTIMNRLGSYMFQMWKLGKSEEIEEQIKNSLTQDLQNQLFLAKQKKFFWRIGFFDQLTLDSQDNVQLFRQWSYLIKQSKYGEDEIIFSAENIPNKIYSVLVGQVQLTYSNSFVTYKCLQDTTFGLQKFFTKEPYGHQCKSLRFSKISFLERSDFQSTIKLYPITYQKYIETLEQIKIYKKVELTGQMCWICSSSMHIVTNCPDFFEIYDDIKNSAQIKLELRIKQQQLEKRMLFKMDQKNNLKQIVPYNKKYRNNNRRSFLRRYLKKQKILSKSKLFSCIQIDSVKYFHNYRRYGNI